MKIILILFTTIFIFVKVAVAQINESDTSLFQIRASLTGNYQKGNVNLLALRSRLEFSIAPTPNFVFKSQNVSLYQAFGKIKADNELFSRNFIYYKPNKRIYPFALAFISTNFRRKIDFRYFTGAGGTVQVIKESHHVVKISASAVYESSHFKGITYNFAAYNGREEINLWRTTTWLWGRHDLFDKKIRLTYDLFWQPAFNDRKNYRWQTDAGIEFPVWKGLAFNALYTYAHENVVIQNIKQNDQILTFGFTYNYRQK